MFYYTMWHKGGLKESVESIWEIEDKTFQILTKTGLYKIYGYDERIKALRYIIRDIENNLGMPTWLLASDTELY